MGGQPCALSAAAWLCPAANAAALPLLLLGVLPLPLPASCLRLAAAPSRCPLPLPQVTLAAVMVTHVPLGGGADEGSLGLVQNIGLSHDRGWRDR